MDKRGRTQRYTDDDLIEWIKTFDNISDLRKSDMSKYITCRRRGLDIYFPKKRIKAPNSKGKKVVIDKPKVERKSVKRAEKPLKEDRAIMYRGYDLENGNIICGRCLEEKNNPCTANRNLCKGCFSRYSNLKAINKDHNKWNVRDEFCHTRIKHHEKVFEIGLKVDEKTQQYLSMIGYDFIFKEVYDK